MTDEEIGAEAVEIANEIERVMDGRSSVACLLALGMVIGRAALDGKKPDLDGLMERLRSTAASVMRQHQH